MPNKRSIENLQKGAEHRWVKGDVRAKEGQAKGVQTKRRKAAARKVFQQVLGSIPMMDPATLNTLKKLGIESTDDVDIQTIIAVAIAQKGMRGDVKAATLAFEMSGESASTEVQKERLKLEKERLKLDKERLEFDKKMNANGGDDEDLEDPLLQALRADPGEVVSDVPEDVDEDEDLEEDASDGGE